MFFIIKKEFILNTGINNEMLPDTDDLPFKFHKAQAAFPALLAGATPLGAGRYGLVVDHHDGTVSKICFNDPESADTPNNARDCMLREIEALRMLQGHCFDQVRTPALVDEPVIMAADSGDYIGHFRMTKLEGKPKSWFTLLKCASPAVREQYFEQVGKLVAQFHQFTAPAAIETPQRTPVALDHESFNDETRAMVIEAHDYLMAHRQDGCIHGDFHSKNVMSDETGRLTALFDFSFYGKTDNHLMEFSWVMNQHPKALAPIIKGYEQESGQTVDIAALKLTAFHLELNRLLQTWEELTPAEHPDKIRAVNETVQTRLHAINKMHP